MKHVRVVLLLCLLVPGMSHAFPIASTGDGLSVFVNSTNDIIATYEGNSASYSNDLYYGLTATVGATNVFLFNNHDSAVGSTVNLGSFDIGTELVFRLHVTNTGDDFYTGAANRNSDNHTHARVQDNWNPNTTLVSFEDLYNGPFVFNDLSFSFTNTSSNPDGAPNSEVPEPASMILFGIGLAGLAAIRRSKN